MPSVVGTDSGPLERSFEFVHANLDEFKIKEKVDEIGIDAYINYCASLAGASGDASGALGGISLIFGIPADLANNIAQQVRVTLAVIYHRTGHYRIPFAGLMKIVALSLGIEIGATTVKILTVRIANEVLKRLTASTAGRVVPILGGLIGAGVNFAFIKAIGKALMALPDSAFAHSLDTGGAAGEIMGA